MSAVRQLLQPTQDSPQAPVIERPYDPVIDWERDLAKERPLVSEPEQWFLLVALWWGATVMAAVQLGFL